MRLRIEAAPPCARKLPLAIDDAALGQIVRRKLDVDFVARHDADEVFPHFAGHVSQNFGACIELHLESCVRQRLRHRPADDKRFLFFGHRGSSTHCSTITYKPTTYRPEEYIS